MLYKKSINILYIANQGLWEESLAKIREELLNNKYIREVFWPIIPNSSKDFKNKKWRQNEIELMNGTRLQTISKGMQVRWKRPDKIIFDDPQENSEVYNIEIVEKFNSWFFTSLYNTLLPWSSICVLWTIVWNLCLVKKIKDSGWNTIEYKAINKGKSLWWEMWSLEELEIRKKEIWSVNFNQEFMNIPVSKENTLLKDEQILYFETSPESFDMIVMGVDPAISEKASSDFTGITIIWLLKDKKYVLYSKWIKLSPTKLIWKIKDLNKNYSVDVIIWESNIESYLAESLIKNDLPIKKVRANKSKFDRFLKVIPDIENENVLFLREFQNDLIYQMLNFPDLRHDDILDSFVHALDFLIFKENNVILI